MGKFDSKTLLMLGTTSASVDIVKYAKSEGAKVIVTDYLPVEKSEAKQYADKTFMISTNDIEKIKQLVIDEKIDGVLAGASEFNLQIMQKVTSEMDLPCYFTKEQWDVMSNKLSFKNLCMKYNIPVPLKYDVNIDSSDDELKKIKYPVMVKPVDCSSGLGIHSCRNMSELREGMADAFEKSFSHVIIV